MRLIRPADAPSVTVSADSRGVALRIGGQLFLTDPAGARILADRLHDAADAADSAIARKDGAQ